MCWGREEARAGAGRGIVPPKARETGICLEGETKRCELASWGRRGPLPAKAGHNWRSQARDPAVSAVAAGHEKQ